MKKIQHSTITIFMIFLFFLSLQSQEENNTEFKHFRFSAVLLHTYISIAI